MTKTVNFNVQRWIFIRGNYKIVCENAWDTNFQHSQERITVNGEPVIYRTIKVYFLLFWRTIFEDTVLTAEGELTLKVQWKSGLKTIRSRLLINGEKQEWADYSETKWHGTVGQWPNEAHWTKQSSR